MKKRLTNHYKKLIALPNEIKQLIAIEAARMGISVNEYIEIAIIEKLDYDNKPTITHQDSKVILTTSKI